MHFYGARLFAAHFLFALKILARRGKDKNMKRFKKMLSLLLVGVIAVTSLFCGTVTASAASSKASLLSLDITKIDSKATGIGSLGQDLYILYSDSYRAVYRIGSDEIKKWRSSGKLKATKITVDSDITKYIWKYNSSVSLKYGDYTYFSYKDNNNITHYYILKYEKDKNKLTEIYTTTNYIGISSDGTMSEFIYDSNKKVLTLKILNSNGKLVKKHTYDLGDNCYWYCYAFEFGSQYAYVTYWKEKDRDTNSNDYDKLFKVGNHYIIGTNGKQKKISDLIWAFGFIAKGKNYVAFEAPPADSVRNVYLTEKNKTYNLDSISNFSTGEYKVNYKYYELIGFANELFGTKAIGQYQYTDNSDPNNKKYEYKYALVNVKNDKFISAKYDYMNTYDNGETFLVEDSKGQWGYLNAKGKKLAMFTDAAAFYGSGKYAPVIKGGNIYLIDKNMKQVSKTIKSDKDSGVTTLDDELFKYTKGGKNYIMTNK